MSVLSNAVANALRSRHRRASVSRAETFQPGCKQDWQFLRAAWLTSAAASLPVNLYCKRKFLEMFLGLPGLSFQVTRRPHGARYPMGCSTFSRPQTGHLLTTLAHDSF